MTFREYVLTIAFTVLGLAGFGWICYKAADALAKWVSR